MNKNKKSIFSVKIINSNIEAIWFACLFFNLLVSLFSLIAINKGEWYHIMNVITISLIPLVMAYKIGICDRLEWKEVIFSAIILIVVCLAYRLSGEEWFFALSSLVLGARNISFQKIIRYYYYFCVAGLMAVLLLFSLGVLHDAPAVRYDEVGRIIAARHSLGFKQPNSLGLWWMMTVISAVLYRGESIKAKTIIICVLGTCFVYWISNSRTSCITIFFLIGCMMIHKLTCIRIPIKAFGYCAIILVLMCLFVSIAAPVLYYNTVSTGATTGTIFEINNITTARAYLSSVHLYTEGITVFGQKLVRNECIDNLYVYTLVRLGGLSMLIWLGMMFQTIRRATKVGNMTIIIVCVGVALYSLMEKRMISVDNMVILATVANLSSCQTCINEKS